MGDTPLTADQVTQMISDALDQREYDNQMNVSPIAIHAHTGTDTSQVAYGNLTGTPIDSLGNITYDIPATTPTVGEILTVASVSGNTATLGYTAQTPVYDVSNQFIDFLPWNSIDGWTTSGPGTFSPLGTSLDYTIGAGGNNGAIVTKGNYPLFVTGKAVTFDFAINTGAPGAAGQVLAFMLYNGNTFVSLTTAHVGFKFVTSGSGFQPANLYGTVADGTTEAITPSLAIIGSTSAPTYLKLVFTPGTDCKFYLNQVLVATLTTNLPSTAVYPNIMLYFSTQSAEDFNLSRILLERQY